MTIWRGIYATELKEGLLFILYFCKWMVFVVYGGETWYIVVKHGISKDYYTGVAFYKI